jgi:cystathionine gamma-lyase
MAHLRSLFSNLGIGAVPSPFDCFLANRGLKTLHLRMKQHEENANKIARYLEGSDKVAEVIYPGMITCFILFFSRPSGADAP